jgi:hypothetical protein
MILELRIVYVRLQLFCRKLPSDKLTGTFLHTRSFLGLKK